MVEIPEADIPYNPAREGRPRGTYHLSAVISRIKARDSITKSEYQIREYHICYIALLGYNLLPVYLWVSFMIKRRIPIIRLLAK